jgi:hypothetical protein
MQMGQLGIAALTVGRYGVVYLRLHVVVGKILLQLVATWGEDGEDVVNVVFSLGSERGVKGE